MFFQSDDIDTTVPPASDINYSDVAEVCGYQFLLCKMFERAGGFSYPCAGTNSTIRHVQKEGQIWLKEVRRLIASILESPAGVSNGKVSPCLGDIPWLLSSYDLFYRVCNGSPCYGYLREVKLDTTTRWLSGDRSITRTDVTLLLLQEVKRENRTLERRYSDFSIGVMGTWIDELTRHGRFRDIPYTEALSRQRYLLDEDLFVYLGRREQRRIKEE